MINETNLRRWLAQPAPSEDLANRIRKSTSAPRLLNLLRKTVPDLTAIPLTTYTLYRQFEQTGFRRGYESQYLLKRTMLTRAVVELLLGDESMRDRVQDLLWSICEETTWVFPAHEEQGPDFWELKPSPRSLPWGAHTALTREPDAIDLFAAETGASLAETIHLVGDQLAPEVVHRVRQEVDRHIFKPYLAYGRDHWWHKGPLNWNGVCNGSIGLAFMRLERDPQTLFEAMRQVLEGFEAYIATGFEDDGGSIEGISYWNYGLMYYVTLAELLREVSLGELDLLAAPRIKDIAHYPLVTALSPGLYLNFGDAVEEVALEPGIVQRIAERTGMSDLRGLLVSPERLEGMGAATAKLAIIIRDMAWWDGQEHPFPAAANTDDYLPACGVVKFGGKTAGGSSVILAAKAGHNDGHHSHTDIGSLVLHVAGESLLCDPGRGLYSREYFRKERYQNIFCNGIGHNVPVIGGQLQQPGPEFGGCQQYQGEISAHSSGASLKTVAIEFQSAYDLPALQVARRMLQFNPQTGETKLEDTFAFDGTAQKIEEAFVTWAPVELDGSIARLRGKNSTLELTIQSPAGARWQATHLEEDCRINKRAGMLTRLTAALPVGALMFILQIRIH